MTDILDAQDYTPPADDATAQALTKLSSVRPISLNRYPPLGQQFEEWQTPEGARVRFVASRRRPIIDLVLRFQAGSAQDGATPGMAALALWCLDQGTGELNATQFADALAGQGVTMSKELGQDHIAVRLRCLSLPELRNMAVGLMTEMMARPAFRTSDVEKIRQRIISYIDARAGIKPFRLTDSAMATLFANHPYAASVFGTQDGLLSITEQQLRDFHQQHYSANNLSIGLVGDLSREEAEQYIASITSALPTGLKNPPVAALGAATRQNLPIEASGASTHAELLMALPIAPTAHEFPALLVFNQILGATYDSYLSRELRTRRALTYSISCALTPYDAAALLDIEWDIAPEYRDASRALVNQIIEYLCEHGPSQSELELAMSTLLGGYLQGTADNAWLARTLCKHAQQGQPADYLQQLLDAIAQLTPHTVRQTAAQVLSMRSEVFSYIGPDVAQIPLPQVGTPGR